jgi:hypothetical protein
MHALTLYRFPGRVIDALIDATERLARRGRVSFVVVFAVAALLVVSVVAPLVPLGAHHVEPTEDLLSMVVALVIAPLLETLVLQMGPAAMVRAFGGGERVVFLAASIPFGLIHLGIALRAGAATLLLGGFLALSFVVWSRRSFKQAYWMTAAVHAVYNLLIFGVVIATGSFNPRDATIGFRLYRRCVGRPARHVNVQLSEAYMVTLGEAQVSQVSGAGGLFYWLGRGAYAVGAADADFYAQMPVGLVLF